MITEDGQVKITDFGIAKIDVAQTLTQTGEMVGTPMYMSPEQVQAKRIKIDHRTDIYSLGATFYEMLTLQPPFEGENLPTITRKILNKEPRFLRKISVRIAKDLETICLKALQKEQKDRYDCTKYLAEDL